MQVRPNFNMAQNAATAFLIRQPITGLVFKPRVLNLIEDGIIIDTIGNYARLTGQRRECFIARNVDNCYTFESDGLNIIFINWSRNDQILIEKYKPFINKYFEKSVLHNPFSPVEYEMSV